MQGGRDFGRRTAHCSIPLQGLRGQRVRPWGDRDKHRSAQEVARDSAVPRGHSPVPSGSRCCRRRALSLVHGRRGVRVLLGRSSTLPVSLLLRAMPEAREGTPSSRRTMPRVRKTGPTRSPLLRLPRPPPMYRAWVSPFGRGALGSLRLPHRGCPTAGEQASSREAPWPEC